MAPKRLGLIWARVLEVWFHPGWSYGREEKWLRTRRRPCFSICWTFLWFSRSQNSIHLHRDCIHDPQGISHHMNREKVCHMSEGVLPIANKKLHWRWRSNLAWLCITMASMEKIHIAFPSTHARKNEICATTSRQDFADLCLCSCVLDSFSCERKRSPSQRL